MNKLLTPLTMWVAVAMLLLPFPASLHATTLFFSGNLRTSGTVLNCGAGCTLASSNVDGDYAQWAAVVDTFVVTTTTKMEAISYSYGGGISQTGSVVSAGGLEPYLSLFDSSGNFLASTYYGTTCPAGAGTVSGNCFDVSLDGGTLTPGTYQIALSAYANMSLAENNGPPGKLADGFTGLGGLAPGEDLNYAFDVILPSVASAPEPISLGLALIGFAVLALSPKNKSKQIY